MKEFLRTEFKMMESLQPTIAHGDVIGQCDLLGVNQEGGFFAFAGKVELITAIVRVQVVLRHHGDENPALPDMACNIVIPGRAEFDACIIPYPEALVLQRIDNRHHNG